MQWFKAFFMSWGMFLAIPCPLKVWDEKARNKMMVALPFIGIIVGVIWAVLAFLLSPVLYPIRALLIAIIPWAVTGFIHLDGYMDVCDAIFSRKDLEKRREILKDPRSGSFAIIFMVILGIASWSVGWFTSSLCYVALLLVPIATRASAGIALNIFKTMDTSQYKKMEINKKHVCILIIILAIAVVMPFALGLFTPLYVPLKCAFAPLIATGGYFLFAVLASRNLKGMNGDISGFSLTIAEFIAYAFLCLI